MARNQKLINKAQALQPEILEQMVPVKRTVLLEKNSAGCLAVGTDDYRGRELATKDSVILDFGDHEVGYLTLHFGYTGSHPDAPAWIEIRFAERIGEFAEDPAAYHGWVSSGWIQMEDVHIDTLPVSITLPRRYAFRYVQIRAIDISTKYKLTITDATVRSVSSADNSRVDPLSSSDVSLRRLDRIAVKTLHDCMQDVFEDGPKRDRRLWMGDLRLEAQANYMTFRQNDLVKRCLYLFAGDTLENGQIGAAIFTTPTVQVDDVRMFDYSLLYIPTLLEYLKQTGDQEALTDLYEIAMNQIPIASERFDKKDVIRDSDVLGWCFVDWNLNLNKQASAQAIYLYCVKAAIELAKIEGDTQRAAALKREYARKKKAAIEAFLDPELGVFISGADRQVSWASQCWMILAGVVDAEEGREILQRIDKIDGVQEMVTPYMYNTYLDALYSIGESEKAVEVMKSYWGGMENAGADTFWELYNPANPEESPYGGTIVLSYCHAWSCAPAYYLRKFANKKK